MSIQNLKTTWVRKDLGSALEGETVPPVSKITDEESQTLPQIMACCDDVSLIKSHAEHFLKVLRVSFGFDRNITSSVSDLTAYWARLGVQSIEKSLKFVYASLFSLCTGQDLPKSPDSAVKNVYFYFPGSIRTFVRAIVKSTRLRVHSNSEARRKMGLSRAQDLLYAKKGSPQVSERLRAGSQASHKKALTEDRSGYRSDSIKRDTGAVLDLENEIKRICKDVFGHKSFSFSKNAKFPSLNSATTGKVSKTAAASASMASSLLGQFEEFDQVPIMHYHPRTGVVSKKVSLFTPTIQMKDTLTAKPAFILEPLKVRPIMMGPAEEYFWLLQMQSYLWNSLARYDTFSLIKGPVTTEFLESAILQKVADIQKQCPEAIEGWEFHSGDYASATDNFKLFWSKFVWDRVCEEGKVPNWLRRTGVKCLVAHDIAYTETRADGSKYIDKKRQTNGQSMGSPISFPVLCILNAALCALSFRQSKESSIRLPPKTLEQNWGDVEEEVDADRVVNNYLSRLHWSKIPFVVNGDDCLNIFTSGAKSRWEYLADFAGLTPSVGKTYYSRDFFVINSQCYQADFKDLESDPEKECFRSVTLVPYFNYALLSAHSARGSEPREWWDLPAMLREWYRCTEGRLTCAQALEHFLYYHKVRLDMVPSNMSWWLPQDLGGLGLEPDGETKIKLHNKQKQVATYLLNHPEERVQLTPPKFGVSRFATEVSGQLFLSARKEGWLDLKDAKSEVVDPLEEALRKQGASKSMNFALWERYLSGTDNKKCYSKPRSEDEQREDVVKLFTFKLYRKMEKLQNKCSAEGTASKEVLLRHLPTVWSINDSVLATMSRFTPRFYPQLNTNIVVNDAITDLEFREDFLGGAENRRDPIEFSCDISSVPTYTYEGEVYIDEDLAP